MNLGGIDLANLRICETLHWTYWARRPRSKKARIRNKWEKNPANWKPRRDFYQAGDKLICHPVMAAKLRAEIEKVTR